MAKQLEFVSGAVRQINSKGTGIKVAGFDDWLNISQYHPVSVMPTVGELVEVSFERTDKGAWIHALQIIGAAPAGPASAPGRERIITRLAVLKAAATFCAGYAQCREDVKSGDVLKIADAWLVWVEKGGDQPA